MLIGKPTGLALARLIAGDEIEVGNREGKRNGLEAGEQRRMSKVLIASSVGGLNFVCGAGLQQGNVG